MNLHPLIHIGFHKTGTTWLQNKLFYSGNQVFEPLSINPSGPSTLAEKLYQDNEGYLLSPFDLNEQAIKSELESIIKGKNKLSDKIPVLSHERLSGNPHVGGFDSKIIAKRIKKIFPEAKILIVIREQKSFIVSAYIQYLSVGGTKSFLQYLNENYDGRKPGFSLNFLEYNTLIKYYMKIFGKSNVLVLPYEMFRKDPRLFVKHLSNFLDRNIEIKDETFRILINKKKYIFTKYKLRKLNAFLKKTSLNDYSFLSNNFSQFIAKSIYFVFKTLAPKIYDQKIKIQLTKMSEKRIGSRFENSNIHLSELINIDLSEYEYH